MRLYPLNAEVKGGLTAAGHDEYRLLEDEPHEAGRIGAVPSTGAPPRRSPPSRI